MKVIKVTELKTKKFYYALVSDQSINLDPLLLFHDEHNMLKSTLVELIKGDIKNESVGKTLLSGLRNISLKNKMHVLPYTIKDIEEPVIDEPHAIDVPAEIIKTEEPTKMVVPEISTKYDKTLKRKTYEDPTNDAH